MAEFITTATGKNLVGTPFKVMRRREDKFSVWKLCTNYDGKVRGGLSQTWRYRVLDVSEAEAMQLFAKSLKGRGR